MKFKHIHIFFFIIVFFGGGIWFASEQGYFNTTRSSAHPAASPGRGRGRSQISATSELSKINQPVQPNQTSQLNQSEEAQILEKLSTEVTEVHDINEIRGSFTLTELENIYKVPAGAFIESFLLDKSTNTSIFRLRDLKELYNSYEIDGTEYHVETDMVKVFVSLYTGIPYISHETFYLPETAVNYLLDNNRLSSAVENYWKEHTFDLASLKINESAAAPIEIKTFSLTGNTTVADLLSMGMDEEMFQGIVGAKVPEDKRITIRNFLVQHGLGFDDVKETVEEYFTSEE